MLITQKQTNKLRFSLTFVTLHHFIHRFTIMMMMMKIWIEKKFSKQQSSCFIFDSFFLSWSLMMVMHLWFHMRKREKLQNFVLHECIDIYTHLKHGDGCCCFFSRRRQQQHSTVEHRPFNTLSNCEFYIWNIFIE